MTQSKRVMIVDDEPSARRSLRQVIDTFEELEVIDEIADGKTAIFEIERLKPDILFLDIEMPEVSGFQVADATKHIDYQLVFATAYDQYAIDAFDTRAIDYLLKPVRPALLEKCIHKILYQEKLAIEALQQEQDNSNNLTLLDGQTMRVIDLEHIAYIEGIGRYRRIHLTQQGIAIHRTETIISDTTLDQFQSQLGEIKFMRLHRSYLVNLAELVGVSTENRRNWAKLQGKALKIPVSRSKVAPLKLSLKR